MRADGVALALCVALAGCGTTLGVPGDFGLGNAGLLLAADRSAGFPAAPLAGEEASSPRRLEPGGDGLSLTLSRTVELALDRSLALLAARKEREVADGQVTEAWSAAFPRLDIAASYTRLDEAPAIDLASLGMGSGSMMLGDDDNYAVGLKLSQPIDLAGQLRAAKRAAVLYRGSIDKQVLAAEQGTVLLACKGFYDVLLARENIDATEEAVGIARSHEEDVRHRRAAGMATEFEVIRASTAAEIARTEATVARHALELARASLFTLLRLEADPRIEVDGGLVFEADSTDRSSAIKTAFAIRPDLASQRSLLAIQREKIVATRAERMPRATVFGEFGYEKPSTRSMGELDGETYWLAGVSLNVPVFDGMRTRGRLGQEYARLSQLEMSVAQLADRIRLEVTEALLNLRQAEELVTSRGNVLAQAREGLRLAQAGYEQGLSRQLDVLEAQLGLTQARRGRAQAIYAHLMAKVGLRRAMGTLASESVEEERQ